MVKCEICGKDFSGFCGLSRHIGNTHSDSWDAKQYYDKFMLKEGEDKCSVCGKETSFVRMPEGYKKYCSLKCSNSSSEVQQKKKDSFMKHYGVSSYQKTQQFKDGVREKMKARSQEETDEIKARTKETNIKRYGVTCALRSKEIMEKTKQTCLEKYGTTELSQVQSITDKKNKTCLEKYGTIHPMQNEEVKKKTKQTCLDKYGVKSPLQVPELIKERQDSMERIYGYRNALQVPEFKRKLSEKSLKVFYDKISNGRERLGNKCVPLFKFEDYKGVHIKYPWKCLACGETFEDDLIFGNIPRCLKCYPFLSGISNMEKDLREVIKKYISEDLLIYNDRIVLKGRELDIYIPSYNLAIEFNGIHWHGESSGKDINYHVSKTMNCLEQGICLIQILEDEWLNKRPIVESIILNKLKLNPYKYYARKCNIKEINDNSYEEFLNENHIQGSIKSSLKFGLYFEDELVSLLTVGVPRFNNNYQYEIHRFCNKLNSNVLGGLSKLFNYFVKTYNPNTIISYADLRYGSGKVYEKLGFDFVKYSEPSYYYYDDFGNRYSRFQFQKHLLKDKLKFFDSRLTEWQNMQINGYDRLYDSGCAVFGWTRKEELSDKKQI